MADTIYRPRERLVILGEHALDYEVEDLDTGACYLIDKAYFKRKYQAEGAPYDDTLRADTQRGLGEAGRAGTRAPLGEGTQ